MLGCILLLGIAALLVTAGCGGDPVAVQGQAAGSGIVSMRADKSGQRPEKPAEIQRRVPEDVRIREVIDGYETTLSESPESPEAKDATLALANLYRQKMQDYSRALFWYERYIDRYGDDSKIAWVFSQAVFCLEKLGTEPELRLMYRKMMDAFPEGSEYHEFARQRYYVGKEEAAFDDLVTPE